MYLFLLGTTLGFFLFLGGSGSTIVVAVVVMVSRWVLKTNQNNQTKNKNNKTIDYRCTMKCCWMLILQTNYQQQLIYEQLQHVNTQTL
jgi:hypothetical protein